MSTSTTDETQDPAEPTALDPARRDRRLLRWILGGVAVVLLVLYGTAMALASDRLPRGTTIAGVEVGGLTPAAAESALEEGLADRTSTTLPVVVGDRRFALNPARAGLEIDIEASVEQVPVGRTWNPADAWEVLVGGVDRDAVVTTDEVALQRALTRIARVVDEPAVEGGVRFTRSGPEAIAPRTGQVLSLGEAADAVVAGFGSDGSEVVLTLVEDASEVTSEEVARAMREFAEPAMSAPVVYDVGGERVVLRPRAFAPALSMVAEDGRLEPDVDRDRLEAALKPALVTLGEQPVDATVAIVGGQPKVIPAKKGVSLDVDRIVETFPDLLVADGPDRTLEMPAVLVEPEFTTADARALGITEEVSEFTTYYPHADYRNVNIGRAADLIDGYLLKPGETFSLNGTVGERTAENGFTEGFIISNGVFREELGGGVSQVATTTFNAAFFAGLEDVEHKPHSFYIDRYPVGREATVAWPTVDLRFRNDTKYGVLIQTVHQPSSPGGTGALTVRMWSTKVWDIESITSERYAFTSPATRVLTGEGCVPNTGYGGFRVDVTRVFREAGESKVVRREVMPTTYTPSDTVICR